ncbi:MAG TPA: glycosyltransferase [Noviherbaspirillum sp.]|nr:glycosyltransferase [Noviherbaspirillum sp.]
MRTGYVAEADRLPLETLLGTDFAPTAVPRHAPATLLVISVSAGAGHVRAAQAICAAANTAGRGTARHIDAMDHVLLGLRAIYTDVYLRIVARHPLMWSWLYHKSNAAHADSLWQRLRRASERWSAQRLLSEIEQAQPQAIVCTHFLPAELLARMRREGRLACPVWVQVTDFDLHRMWVHEGVDGYFAASEEIAYRMRAAGMAADAIRVTGIPVMPAFAQPLERAACAAELGIDARRTTVLLMGGGAGLGRLDETAERLLQAAPEIQMIALAGRNADVLAALRRLAARHPKRLVALGYTEHVERVMACSDLAITKPGGLSTSECLAMGLPMILTQPIPGQEERNADYLLEQGAALKTCDMAALEFRLRQLLGHPAQLAEMRKRALSLARVHAAREVVDTVLPS